MDTLSADRRDDGGPASRALVLGGGGVLGMGWEAGLVDGLAGGGVVLAGADLIVGTSAGSVVGSYLALGEDPANALGAVATFGDALAAAQLEVEPRALIDAMAEAATGASPERGLREVGRLAVEAKTIDEGLFVGLLPRLQGEAWPANFASTATDVETGELRVWDSGAGAPLARAVASSYALPLTLPPVTIGGRRYMDGGLLSPLNADLAAGRDRVVVVSCFPLGVPEGTDDPMRPAWAASWEAELDAVRERGEIVEVIEPGEEFLVLSGGGADLMDVGRGGEAYEAGLRQARVELDRVRAAWNG